MKALVVAAALMMGSSMAMAHGKTCNNRHHRTTRGNAAICQTVFSDAQNARAVCAANGLGWEKLKYGNGSGDGYRCGCGSFDPSAPGTAQ